MKSIKGFNDILPQATAKSPLNAQAYQMLEARLQETLSRFGFSHIRLPILEQTSLFARAIGDGTDIVDKEMYTFFDKSTPPTSLTLRPEGTAGAVRSVLEHNLLRQDSQKLWYLGPMFRYEQPQKGRYRQFHQLGVESFGNALPDAEAELILLCRDLWKTLGVLDVLTLEINSLGEMDERAAYRAALVTYLQAHKADLDPDSQARLTKNPLRILDSKDPKTRQILAQAPKLFDFLGQDTQKHFAELQGYLNALGIPFVINDNLVRGLDYYNKTVFEWTTNCLGAQATVCAGGRFDGLIGQIKGDGKPCAACGFAIGLERLLLLIDVVSPILDKADCDAFLVASKEEYAQAFALASTYRQSGLRIKMGGASSFKSQMKKADKSGARYALILGESEAATGNVTLKDLSQGTQETHNVSDALTVLLQTKEVAHAQD